MKSSTSSKPVLIWAIDPVGTDTKPSPANVAAMVRWAREMGWEIQPVTVATPSAKDLERGLLGSINRFQAALDAFLKSYRLGKIRRGRVLVNEETSQAAAVAKFLRYAKREGGAAIAVSSHGRSGLDRLVLGSFAEKVLEISSIPVFFLNHRAPNKTTRRPIAFFPTDFSKESRTAYREFLTSAAGRKFKVILFHAIPYPIPAAGMGVYLPDGYVEDQQNWATSEGLSWLEEAKAKGVKAESVVRTGGVGSVNGDAVLEAAAEFGASAIVMTATGGALGRLLLGSVAYPVFRANRFLALVYGPKAVAAKRRAASDTQPEARSL